MGKFRKKLKDGRVVVFDIASYEELTGSAAFASRRRLIKNKQRIPFQLQRGDQAKGFDKQDIVPPVADAPVIIKLDENLNYVALPKANYQTKVERDLLAEISGASARRGKEIPPSVFNSIRSQISTRIAQLPATIMIIAEDTTFTGSYNITSGSEKICYSGIVNSQGFIDRTINNFSPTATGATWSFANTSSTFVNGVGGNEFHQSEYTSSFIIRTYASSSHSGSYIGQVATTVSQSRIDSGHFRNYEFYVPSSSLDRPTEFTGSILNTSTAGYYSTVLNANIFGDGNETQFAAEFANSASALYAQPREILTFPHDTVVASGSFFWCNTFETLIGLNGTNNLNYQPIKRVELYWASGSGGLLLPQFPGAGLSGSISPLQLVPFPQEEAFKNMQSGSHIFYDDKLSQPASGGYYTTAAKLNSGSIFAAPPASGIAINAGLFQDIEDRRFAGGLRTGAVIHIAGEGINDFGDPGQNFAQNPFTDVHTSTNTKVLPAATRWNGQSFSSGKNKGQINPGDYDDSTD